MGERLNKLVRDIGTRLIALRSRARGASCVAMLLANGMASAQFVNPATEMQSDQGEAQQSCSDSVYSQPKCLEGGMISGSTCGGCGWPGPNSQTAYCKTTERTYIAADPGYCFTLISQVTTSWVYPTTPCPAGTTFMGSGAGDCVSRDFKNFTDGTAKFGGFGGAGSFAGKGRNGALLNLRTGGAFWAESEFAGGEGVPEFTRYYNSTVLHDIAGIGYGWTHSHFMRLVMRNRGEIRALRPDGASLTFRQCEGVGDCIGDPDVDLALSHNSDRTYKLTRRDGTVENYTAGGVLTTVVANNGQVTTYSYVGTTGKLASVRGPFGHTLTFTWASVSTTSLVKTVTLPNGRVLTLGFSLKGNLESLGNGDSTSKHYVYDSSIHWQHRLLQVVDERQVAVMSFTYASNGDVTESKGTGGFDWMKKSTDMSGRLVVEHVGVGKEYYTPTSVAGGIRITQNEYDTVNPLTPYSGVATSAARSYDGTTGRQTAVADGNGRQAAFAYDTWGRARSITVGKDTPLERTTSFSFLRDWTDAPTVVSAPSVKGGLTAEQTLTYGDTRFPLLPTRSVNSGFKPDGSAISSGLDMAYNASGQMASINGPRSDVQDTVAIAYWSCTTGGKCGQPSSITNAAGQVTRFDDYDGAGLLKQSTSASGVVTRYTYDARGRVLSISDTGIGGLVSTWSASYDEGGRQRQVVDRDGATWTMVYDNASNLMSVTDATGYSWAYTYTPARQVATAQLLEPGGAVVRTATSTYDVRGNEVTTAGASGSTLRSFDTAGNVVASVDPKRGPTATQVVDAVGRVQSTTARDAGVTTIGYNGVGDITSVQTP